MKIQLKRSNVLVENNARQPTAGQMEYGELAVNYNTTDPAIFIKDSNNNIIRIAGKYNIADDGQVELPATPTPPSDPKAGNLWYNNTDGRLYIYYTDEDTSQWVDASPDSWDPSSYPDVTDDTAQSGTLDDRYLMLNSANDPVTGGLNITGGNVGIGTSSPAQSLTVDGANPQFGIADGLGNYSTIAVSKGGAGQGNLIISSSTDADSLIFQRGATENMRIAPSGFLGIGTDNPATNLDVNGSIYFSSRLRSTSGGTAANPSIQPGNDADTGIFHPSDSNTIGFATTGAERMRIDNDGNVGIGTETPDVKLDVAGTVKTETIVFTANQDQPYLIAGTTSYTGASTSWGTYGIQHRFKSNVGGTGRVTIDTVNGEAFCVENGGRVGIGTENPRDKLEVNGNIRFTAAGQGINFNNYGSGANIDNNLLDDYEEGTWTPTIVGGITNPVLQAATAGNYTKIGNVVTFNCDIRVQSGTPNSGNFTIGGLPFSAANIPGNFGVASQSYGNIIVAVTNQREGHISPNNSTIVFYDATTIITGNSPNLNWANGRRMILTGTYIAS